MRYKKIFLASGVGVLLFCWSFSEAYHAAASSIIKSSLQYNTKRIQIEGELVIIWKDAITLEHQEDNAVFFLVDNKNQWIKLQLDKNLRDTLLNHKITANQHAIVKGEGLIPSIISAGIPSEPKINVQSISLQEAVLPADSSKDLSLSPSTANQKWATLLCRFADAVNETPVSLHYFKELSGLEYPGLNHYWHEVSYGSMNLDGSTIAGWYNLLHPRMSYVSSDETQLHQLAMDCINAAIPHIPITDFSGIHLVFNKELDGNAYGGTIPIIINGQSKHFMVTWLPRNAIKQQALWVHEMAHGFGYTDNAWMNACKNREKDYGCIAIHPLSIFKEKSGWIPANRIFQAPQDANQPIRIAPLSSNSFPKKSYLIAVIPDGSSSSKEYIIEARNLSGYDKGLAAEGIVIYKADKENGSITAVIGGANSPIQKSILKTGERFFDPDNHLQITVNAHEKNSYQITITNGNKNEKQDETKSSDEKQSSPQSSAISYAKPNRAVSSDTPPITPGQQLTLQSRIACQRTIEEVYWHHRIWPENKNGSKPSFDEMISPTVIQQKVEDYLRKSSALEQYWKKPITPQQLQAEMNRMAADSKQSQILEELWYSLGSNPYLIAECLAGPILADRLARNYYAYDKRFHGAIEEKAKQALHTGGSVSEMKASGGNYHEVSIPTEKFLKRKSTQPMMIPQRSFDDLKEDQDKFYSMALINQNKKTVRIGIMEWYKIPFDTWWNSIKENVESQVQASNYLYTLPHITATPCTDDTWTPMKGPLITARLNHSAIWTGTEMIIWGGAIGYLGFEDEFFNSGGRYNPSADSWTTTNLMNAPIPRSQHTALWTGSEMIIWGGKYYSHGEILWQYNGARYNPSTDTWHQFNMQGFPEMIGGSKAIWTGTRIIVWGGATDGGGIGAQYNPGSDSWSSISRAGAPAGGIGESIEWTGTEMLIWFPVNLPHGGRYNPNTNSWTAINDQSSPDIRWDQRSLWTGTELIIWGGYYCNDPPPPIICTDHPDGGRYNPVTNTWRSVSTTNAPDVALSVSMTWTGSEMIVWGGFKNSEAYNTGARYNPETDSWTSMSIPQDSEIPVARSSHSAVWTGNEMIIWGGYDYFYEYLNSGARYNPSTDSWTSISINNAPEGRELHSALWTGKEMLIWGGQKIGKQLASGARYNPNTNSWSSMATTKSMPEGVWKTAVWSGKDMITWGTDSENKKTYGAKYNPETNTWKPINSLNAPEPRLSHISVWAGNKMVIWGGYTLDQKYTNTGSVYYPENDIWEAMSAINAPPYNDYNTPVWTGKDMLIWGRNYTEFGKFVGLYNTFQDSWSVSITPDAPPFNYLASIIWTGSEMIVWGGGNYPAVNAGGRFNPITNIWKPTSLIDAPWPRSRHTAVWTGSEMIIWGDSDNAGGKYCAALPVMCNPSYIPFLLRMSQCRVSPFTANPQPVHLSCEGLPQGATCKFSANPLTPPADTTLTIQLDSTAKAGIYTFQVIGTDGTITHAFDMQLHVN